MESFIRDKDNQNKEFPMVDVLYERIFNNINLTSEYLDSTIDDLLSMDEYLIKQCAECFVINGFYYSAIKVLYGMC